MIASIIINDDKQPGAQYTPICSTLIMKLSWMN